MVGVCGYQLKLKKHLNWACIVAVSASREIVKDYIQEMKDPGGYISDHKQIAMIVLI